MSAPRLIELLPALSRAQVEYVVCGGVACILHGVMRATHDLDLQLRMTKENLERFIAFCKQHDLQPRIPEPIESFLNETDRQRWRDERGALVFTVQDASGLIQIDAFLDYPIDYEALRKGADTAEIAGQTIYISSRDDLLKVKESIPDPRPHDLQDIEALRRLEHE